ncbi:Apoptosis inhibitor 5-like protein API5 [Camellia lanceoleosa]|uniref:Apoptosis inhibitor 5-like protein API5 n=1 Tax=Camellia lanceoleosa TaxID=1840588 RepID=A0ACC0HBA1_9ERIC|nr:Apoptosis inhibitor 5-like protein API5 [Camellia lanceoleosa]
MTFANGGGLTVRPWAAEEWQAEELKVGMAAEMGGETVLLVSLHSCRNSRLSSIEELARATIKKLTQHMTEHNKAMASAKSDEAKASVKAQKQNPTTGLQTCNNILAMTQRESSCKCH